jgi:chromosome segregation ATPase
MTPERSAGSPSDDSQLAASPVEGWRELVAELRLRSATLEERAEKALIERDTAKAAMASATDLAKSAVDQLAELEAANATLTERLEDALSYAGALEERLSRAVDLPPASPAASTSPA